MREVEVKAVVSDAEAKQRLAVQAGARLMFEGHLRDRRYDTTDGSLLKKDEVVRVRSYVSRASTEVFLDWKGATDTSSGYKVREEVSTGITDEKALATMLDRLGFSTVREIDRRIVQYELGQTTIRFEFYPRMDDLVEIEGDPEAIERAIEALGMSRGEFTSEALGAFVERFQRRTGVKAAISDGDLAL